MNFLLLLSFIFVAIFAVSFAAVEHEDTVLLEEVQEDNALFKAIESEYPFQSKKQETLPSLRQIEIENESPLSKAVSLEAHMMIAAIDNTEEQDHVYIVLDSVDEESIHSASPTEVPSAIPTLIPTPRPTPMPSTTPMPSVTPSVTPIPSATPSTTPMPSATPSVTPIPSATPSTTPMPSATPSVTPTAVPTLTPSLTPTKTPTGAPTANPTFTPGSPTPRPSRAPTYIITAAPTVASVLKFNSTFTLGGLDVLTLTDVDREAIRKTTAVTMGINPSTVRLLSVVQVTIRRRALANSNLLAEAILQVIQEVTGGADPTALYQQLTTQLTQAVSSNNFTAVLQTVSKALGANATATAQVTKLVNNPPVIDYSPQQSPTFSPTNGPKSSDSKSLSAGEIAGIVIGTTFGVVLLIGLLLWMKAHSVSKATLIVHPTPATNTSLALVEV